MSETLRVRGEEVQVRLHQNGQLILTLTEIVSCTLTFKFDKLIEQFLGKSSDSLDEIYRHTDVALAFQPRSQDSLILIETIQQRAQRRVAQNSLQINLAVTMQFPNGDRPRVLVPDLSFGDIPLNIAGRDKYVEQSFDCSGETFQIAR